MDTGIENRLEHALAVAPSEQAQLLLMDAVTESERKAGMGAFARLGRKSVAAVALIVALSGGAAVTAVAAPDFLATLFPPAVSNTFTFASGVECTADTKIVPDFQDVQGTRSGGRRCARVPLADGCIQASNRG